MYSARDLQQKDQQKVKDEPRAHYLRLQYLRVQKNIGHQQLSDEYARSIQLLDFVVYAQDEHLLRIWLDMIQMHSDQGYEQVQGLYEKMRTLEVGVKLPLFYQHWCDYLVGKRKYAEAVVVMQHARRAFTDDQLPVELQ